MEDMEDEILKNISNLTIYRYGEDCKELATLADFLEAKFINLLIMSL